MKPHWVIADYFDATNTFINLWGRIHMTCIECSALLKSLCNKEVVLVLRLDIIASLHTIVKHSN